MAMRLVDLLAPIGKGQRGMIVSPPKAGKTTLLKEVALSVKKECAAYALADLLIDERPEEVTDIKEAIEGPKCRSKSILPLMNWRNTINGYRRW